MFLRELVSGYAMYERGGVLTTMLSSTLAIPPLIRTPGACVHRLERQGSEAERKLTPLRNNLHILMLVWGPQHTAQIQSYARELLSRKSNQPYGI